MTNNVQQIYRYLRDSFGDLEAPHYAKVTARLDARSTWPELGSIIQRFWTKDVTDTNEDLSMRLLLKDGIDEFALELSAVGPYAALMILLHGKFHLMSLKEISADARLESALDNLLKSRTFLSQSEMEEEVLFKAVNTESSHSRVYNALFSDVEILPWHEFKRTT